MKLIGSRAPARREWCSDLPRLATGLAQKQKARCCALSATAARPHVAP